MTAFGQNRKAAVLRASLTLTLMLTGGCRSRPVLTVPDATLQDVQGDSFSLLSRPAQPLLLAFLQTVPDTVDTASRSQVVFLASMAHQYGPRGLRVAVVDASALALGSPPAPDAVRNARYDWHLDFPLLVDPADRVTRQMGVTTVPTTFLIAADGSILREWRGLTGPAVFALAIEKLMGGPLAQAAQPQQRITHERPEGNGGEGGIRTPDTLTSMPDFESENWAFARACTGMHGRA
jgi:hypothetical protein